MSSWSRFAGAPPFAEGGPARIPGAPKRSVTARLVAARRVALVAGAVVAWAGVELALLLAARLGADAAAAAWTTGARALPGGLVAGLGLPVPPFATALTLLFTAALAGGFGVHAAGLAASTGGAAPAWPPLRRAWRARSAGDLLAPPEGVPAAAFFRHLGRGLALPVLVLADAAVTGTRRAMGRVTGRAWDRVHADVRLDAVADALVAQAFEVARGRGVLDVRVPASPDVVRLDAERGAVWDADDAGAAQVRVRATRLRIPRVDAPAAVDITGPREAVRRVRRVIEESDVAFLAHFAWSDEGRRLEARVNALAAEARGARTVEGLGTLMEEAAAFDRVLAARDLVPEERTLLHAWKLARVRRQVLEALTEARGDEDAPAPTRGRPPRAALGPWLAPRPDRVVAVGGLAGLRDLVFVPHLVVPVACAWGEQAVVVDALTGAGSGPESRRLLTHAAAHPPRVLRAPAAGSRFIPAPPAAAASAAVAPEVRRVLRHDAAYWGPVTIAVTGVEVVWVPFAENGDEGLVNAITGTAAPTALAERVRAAARAAHVVDAPTQ